MDFTKCVLISICIPAYKRVEYLERLLASISIQEYRDFEVVVSDDSPDNSVQELCAKFSTQFPIKLLKNEKALGTPENWNHAIRHASGEWIKLMHDDDWFSTPTSLREFANAAKDNPGAIIFSSYKNVFLDENREEEIVPPTNRLRWVQLEPATLFSSNCIGPPSVIMHPASLAIEYDRTIKWVVDIDFYVRALEGRKLKHIESSLINVGMSQEQVTVSCVHNPNVEIPENFYMLSKLGFKKMENWLVYDAFWRLIRNLNIRSLREIELTGYTQRIPASIEKMILWQNKIPRRLLRIGLLSKVFMFFNFLMYRKHQ